MAGHSSPAGHRVDMSVTVGGVELPVPVMTAAGTSGYGAELGAYFDLSRLGAVVVKSLSAQAWAGNPPVRVVETDVGMLNSVGLDNPGTPAWVADHLPALVRGGARVVASVWGRSTAEYVAAVPTGVGPGVVAVEVNLSCPNLGGGGPDSSHVMFAHDPGLTAEVVEAVVAVAGRPVWAKLSPNTADLVAVAGAALEAGASALTLVNTLAAMAVDPVARRARLGAGAGGLSGPALRPVAVRAVHLCRRAFPAASIVGVGGVATGGHAAEMMVAGADAVQVGTATFVDPRAPLRVAEDLERWCARHRVARVADLVGTAP